MPERFSSLSVWVHSSDQIHSWADWNALRIGSLVNRRPTVQFRSCDMHHDGPLQLYHISIDWNVSSWSHNLCAVRPSEIFTLLEMSSYAANRNISQELRSNWKSYRSSNVCAGLCKVFGREAEGCSWRDGMVDAWELYECWFICDTDAANHESLLPGILNDCGADVHTPHDGRCTDFNTGAYQRGRVHTANRGILVFIGGPRGVSVARGDRLCDSSRRFQKASTMDLNQHFPPPSRHLAFWFRDHYLKNAIAASADISPCTTRRPELN